MSLDVNEFVNQGHRPDEGVREAVAPPPPGAHGRIIPTIRASEVEPTAVEWLWPAYLPRGKLTVLDGDPGTGKTSIALKLTACVTRGRALPSGREAVVAPRAVVFLSNEDGMADTLRPRLEAAGADLDRVHFFDSRDPRTPPPVLPDDAQALEDLVREKGAALLVVDPLMAYLDGEVNSHRDQDVRRALAPLAAMAERTGCAVLVIRHLNKANGNPALYRGGGSIGIVGAARSALLAARDPDDDGAFVLASMKSNLGPPPPSLRYRIGTENGIALIQWGGESPHTADSLLARPDPEGASKLDDAEALLRELLAAGPQPQSEVEAEARRRGIAPRTLRRAKERLAVESRKAGHGPWMWSLLAKMSNSLGWQPSEPGGTGSDTKRPKQQEIPAGPEDGQAEDGQGLLATFAASQAAHRRDPPRPNSSTQQETTVLGYLDTRREAKVYEMREALGFDPDPALRDLRARGLVYSAEDEARVVVWRRARGPEGGAPP